MHQRIPAHARPPASSRVFGAAEQWGSAGTGASLCLGRCCVQHKADIRLPAAGAGRLRWVHPLSLCFPIVCSTWKLVAFVTFFHPALIPRQSRRVLFIQGGQRSNTQSTNSPPNFCASHQCSPSKFLRIRVT